jgi:hypothetical protein
MQLARHAEFADDVSRSAKSSPRWQGAHISGHSRFAFPAASAPGMANVAWRASVLKSLKQNGSLPNAKYIQVVRAQLSSSTRLSCASAGVEASANETTQCAGDGEARREAGQPERRVQVRRCWQGASQWRARLRCRVRPCRGFLGDTEHPTFVTDARSEKARLAAPVCLGLVGLTVVTNAGV